ncbi:MAG: ester cyclase [Candidatus Riflebacteria bacterium]|nr:ester cyclase [Candidatus Riflebacteria bacterium]
MNMFFRKSVFKIVVVVVLSITAVAWSLESSRTPKEIVADFYAKCLTINAGDTDASVTAVMDNLFSTDFQSINTNGVAPATDISNKQGMINGVIGLRGMVPDLKWEPQEFLVDGNTVIVRSKAAGTTKGEFLGLNLPVAKPFNIMAIDIHTVENGQIKTVYHVEEWATAIQQLTK